MKLAIPKKKPLVNTLPENSELPHALVSVPPTHPSSVQDQPTFFQHIAKQVGRKPFWLGLHLSRTLVDQWCTGEKRDVFTAAKEACDIVSKERCGHLIPAILVYIAGAEFDGAVLQRITQALQVMKPEEL